MVIRIFILAALLVFPAAEFCNGGIIYVLDRAPTSVSAMTLGPNGAAGSDTGLSGIPSWNWNAEVSEMGGIGGFGSGQVGASGDDRVPTSGGVSTFKQTSFMSSSDFELNTGSINESIPQYIPSAFVTASKLEFSLTEDNGGSYPGLDESLFQETDIYFSYQLDISNSNPIGTFLTFIQLTNLTLGTTVETWIYDSGGSHSFASILDGKGTAGNYTYELLVENFFDPEIFTGHLSENFVMGSDFSAFISLGPVPEPSSIVIFGLMFGFGFPRKKRHWRR